MKFYSLGLLLLPFIANSQKVENAKFDPIDSIFSIETKEEVIVGRFIRGNYLAFNCIGHNFHSQRFKNLPNANTVTVSFSFRTTSTTSLDQSSMVKIQFVDSIVREYKNVLPYSIYSSGDLGYITIAVGKDDYILSHAIKTIRIRSSSDQNDYELPEKKQSLIKDCLLLVFGYKE